MGAKYRNCDENGTSRVEIRIFPFFFRCEVQELYCFRYFEPGQPRFVGSYIVFTDYGGIELTWGVRLGDLPPAASHPFLRGPSSKLKQNGILLTQMPLFAPYHPA